MYTVGVREGAGYVYERRGRTQRRAALSFDMRGQRPSQYDLMAFPGEEPPADRVPTRTPPATTPRSGRTSVRAGSSARATGRTRGQRCVTGRKAPKQGARCTSWKALRSGFSAARR